MIGFFVNNTDEINVKVINPGDEIMAIYGTVLLEQLQSKVIGITPKQLITNIQLKMDAIKYNWKLRSQFSSK